MPKYCTTGTHICDPVSNSNSMVCCCKCSASTMLIELACFPLQAYTVNQLTILNLLTFHMSLVQ